MYLSKYSKYAEGLLINMSHFYIHHGLPWKTLLFLHLTGFNTTYSILYDHPPDSNLWTSLLSGCPKCNRNTGKIV